MRLGVKNGYMVDCVDVPWIGGSVERVLYSPKSSKTSGLMAGGEEDFAQKVKKPFSKLNTWKS